MNVNNKKTRTFLFRCQGQSMWPFVRDGQLLIASFVEPSRLKKGDVILYKSGDATVCHRIVARSGSGGQQYFIVRGDNTLGPVERVEADAIVAKVCGIIRGNKKVQWEGFGFDAANMIILVVAPLTAFIVQFTNRFSRKR